MTKFSKFPKFLDLLTSWVLQPNIGLSPSLRHTGSVACAKMHTSPRRAVCAFAGECFGILLSRTRRKIGPTMGQHDQDALLHQYLNEDDPAIAQTCLQRLLLEYAEPLVRDITRYKSRTNCNPYSGNEAQDEEDVRSEAVLGLISRLQDLRSSGAKAPIENFRGYVAATTYNAYYKYVRMKYPARWRLKNRVRYLLRHARGFTIWQNEDQEYLCGLAKWGRSQSDNKAGCGYDQASVDAFLNGLAPGKNVAAMKLAELVKALLDWLGRPILMDDLVDTVADLQGIRDLQPAAVLYGEWEKEDSVVDVCDLLPSPAKDMVGRMEERSHLERLWMEICELPQRQRVALLLNLRDVQGRDALILFTYTGITSLRRIAQSLELPIEEFAAIWNKLPLEDAAIASLLGSTRQQVINLRKSARERLARRMAAPCSRNEGGQE